MVKNAWDPDFVPLERIPEFRETPEMDARIDVEVRKQVAICCAPPLADVEQEVARLQQQTYTDEYATMAGFNTANGKFQKMGNDDYYQSKGMEPLVCCGQAQGFSSLLRSI